MIKNQVRKELQKLKEKLKPRKKIWALKDSQTNTYTVLGQSGLVEEQFQKLLNEQGPNVDVVIIEAWDLGIEKKAK